MRGLVVVAGGMLLAFLLMGGITTAETKKSVEVVAPASITCSVNNGTYVVFKANQSVHDLVIKGVCKKEEVPKGWTLQCHTDRELPSVEVHFKKGNVERVTRVVCS